MSNRRCLPKHPVALQDLVISDEWTITNSADPWIFMIHDSGPRQHQCVLEYAAEEQVRHKTQGKTKNNCHYFEIK